MVDMLASVVMGITKPSPRRTIGIPTRSLELVKRFRIACIEDGRSGEQLLAAMLDQRDKNRARARHLMSHPLHRDGAEAATVAP